MIHDLKGSTMTLERGDIISTGTPAGVVLGSKLIQAGVEDIVDIEIEDLGHISNTVKDIRG